jgi:HK97 family phage prohead protease
MNGSNIELRANGDSGLTLEGYASTFGVFYPIGVGVDEKMRPGAFKRSLAEGPAVALRVEHSALPLAHTKGGTLELSEDRTGLLTVASLNPRDPDVQSLQAKAENSPLQMSFAFRCNKDSWNEDRSRREVIEAGLHKGDVSIVCYGANEATGLSINARAGASSLEERRAFAERIRGYTGGPKWGLTLAAEEPRGRSQIRVPTFRYLETAKARRAGGHPGSDASVEGEEDGPRYTQAEVDALGEKGLALKRKSGPGYHYPIADRRDLLNAIREWGRAKPSERAGVRTWIRLRARVMRMENLLPKSWQMPLPPGHGERPDSGATESVGGQE